MLVVTRLLALVISIGSVLLFCCSSIFSLSYSFPSIALFSRIVTTRTFMTPLGVLYVPIWSRAIICSSGFSVLNMYITHPFTLAVAVRRGDNMPLLKRD